MPTAAGRGRPAPSQIERRREAYRRGLGAETLALLALRLKGYRPLGRRVRLRAMEIDLVVGKRDVVAFVEVKARRTRTQALEAVGPRHARRAAAAARQWLALNPEYAAHTLRFDLVLVVPGRWPIHLPNAFEAP